MTGATIRVSVATDGTQADGASGGYYAPAISADGRCVLFSSVATNLVGVGNDTNGFEDAFLRDTVLNTTTRVSTDCDGAQANGATDDWPSISADGRYVAFASAATNLVKNAAQQLLEDRVQPGYSPRYIAARRRLAARCLR